MGATEDAQIAADQAQQAAIAAQEAAEAQARAADSMVDTDAATEQSQAEYELSRHPII